MTDMIKYVENMLTEYTDKKSKLKVLEYELTRITPSLRPADIEGSVLAHPNIERVSGSGVGDKTGDLVIEHFDRQRSSQYYALITIISNLKQELNQLDYYLSLLRSDEEAILRRYYIDGISRPKIEAMCKISVATIRRRKKRGIERLAEFYITRREIRPLHGGDNDYKMRFIGYAHEERFLECKARICGREATPAETAVLYLLTGCVELWVIGVNRLFDFERFELAADKPQLTESGETLWRLAAMIAQGLEQYDIRHVIRTALTGLQHLNLELAIEAILIALNLST